MKRSEQLSQRDRAKLETVKKMLGCSPEYRAKLITSVIKNVVMKSMTDDDEQKVSLLLDNSAYYAPQCSSGYRALCEVIVKSSSEFDASLVRKAYAFAKANGFKLRT